MDNLQLKVDDVKDILRKNSLTPDLFWKRLTATFSFTAIASAGGRSKRSGASIRELFEISMAFPLLFTGTVHSFFSKAFKQMTACGASTFYRFRQDSRVDWRRILFKMNKLIRTRERQAGLSTTHPTALILDDSVISKSGKRIEGVSKVHDHTEQRFKTGYKLLGLCWFNGTCARFLDFSLVAEKRLSFKRERGQFKKTREQRSPGQLRKAELNKDKITLGCELVARAVKNGYCPDFVLVDTWFTCKRLINYVRSLAKGSIHFLGMVKHSRRKYIFEAREYTLNKLRKEVMGSQQRCSRYKSRYIKVVCRIPEVGVVTIFFSRFHGRKKWVALLTTDPSLSYTKAIEVYATRWNIEIGFRETKQLFALGKCQANDFDAQVAHMTAALIAHSMLVWLKHLEEHSSLGILYAGIQDQHTTLLTMSRILLMLEVLLCEISESLGGVCVVTIHELLHSAEYSMFKQLIEKSLFFDGIANDPFCAEINKNVDVSA